MRYTAAAVLVVEAGTLATLAATMAAAYNPIFSNPFCCAASARWYWANWAAVVFDFRVSFAAFRGLTLSNLPTLFYGRD